VRYFSVAMQAAISAQRGLDNGAADESGVGLVEELRILYGADGPSSWPR
jgi:hypothetical protein